MDCILVRVDSGGRILYSILTIRERRRYPHGWEIYALLRESPESDSLSSPSIYYSVSYRDQILLSHRHRIDLGCMINFFNGLG
jgi:hypothetical protein